ncbi:vacuole effluxer Atg22 like-domain-containing protein [Glomus cerebriforme]|uniref:Autophagy-related protein n=1 Tax=Glomus cerebriforme TaxID=658196 RepID=A0A397SZN9_9GLOM|nr:vacuole effluxer Atg22 like-domain-containing protein [Glomus cerebriforme]
MSENTHISEMKDEKLRTDITNTDTKNSPISEMEDEKILQTDITDEDEKEPLSSNELKGWYTYNFACAVYDIAVIALFIPVVLENLATKAGYELDHVTPCNTTVANYKCVVKFGNGYADTKSYSFYMVALSILLQCILLISSSSLADHGDKRKNFLLFYSYIGAIATSSFALVLKAGNQSGTVVTVQHSCFTWHISQFIHVYIQKYYH